MALPPNRVQTNRVYIVTNKRYPGNDWRVLAASRDEALRVVLNEEPRLDYEQLRAEEMRP